MWFVELGLCPVISGFVLDYDHNVKKDHIPALDQTLATVQRKPLYYSAISLEIYINCYFSLTVEVSHT